MRAALQRKISILVNMESSNVIRQTAIMREKFRKLQRTARQAFRIIAIASAAALAVFVGFTKQVIDTGIQFEKFRIQLKVLYRDAKKGNEVFEWLTKFAIKTPFELPELVEATVKLKATALNAKTLLKDIGDLASAAQKPLSQVVMAFSNIQSGLKGLGMKQLRILNINKTMLQQQGILYSKAGAILSSNLEVIQGAQRVIQERFSGMMEEQAKTTGGILSNLADVWIRFLGYFDTTFMRVIKKDLQALQDWGFALLANGKAQQMAETIGKKMVETYYKLKEVAWKVLGTIQKIWNLVKPIINWFIDNYAMVETAAIVLITAKAANAVWNMVAGLKAAVAIWHTFALPRGIMALMGIDMASKFGAAGSYGAGAAIGGAAAGGVAGKVAPRVATRFGTSMVASASGLLIPQALAGATGGGVAAGAGAVAGAVSSAVPIVLAVLAVAAVGAVAYKMIDNYMDKHGTLTKRKKEMDKIVGDRGEKTDRLESLSDDYSELSKKAKLTTEENNKLKKVIAEIVDILPKAKLENDLYGKSLNINTAAVALYVERTKQLVENQNLLLDSAKKASKEKLMSDLEDTDFSLYDQQIEKVNALREEIDKIQIGKVKNIDLVKEYDIQGEIYVTHNTLLQETAGNLQNIYKETHRTEDGMIKMAKAAINIWGSSEAGLKNLKDELSDYPQMVKWVMFELGKIPKPDFTPSTPEAEAFEKRKAIIDQSVEKSIRYNNAIESLYAKMEKVALDVATVGLDSYSKKISILRTQVAKDIKAIMDDASILSDDVTFEDIKYRFKRGGITQAVGRSGLYGFEEQMELSRATNDDFWILIENNRDRLDSYLDWRNDQQIAVDEQDEYLRDKIKQLQILQGKELLFERVEQGKDLDEDRYKAGISHLKDFEQERKMIFFEAAQEETKLSKKYKDGEIGMQDYMQNLIMLTDIYKDKLQIFDTTFRSSLTKSFNDTVEASLNAITDQLISLDAVYDKLDGFVGTSPDWKEDFRQTTGGLDPDKYNIMESEYLKAVRQKNLYEIELTKQIALNDAALSQFTEGKLKEGYKEGSAELSTMVDLEKERLDGTLTQIQAQNDLDKASNYAAKKEQIDQNIKSIQAETKELERQLTVYEKMDPSKELQLKFETRDIENAAMEVQRLVEALSGMYDFETMSELNAGDDRVTQARKELDAKTMHVALKYDMDVEYRRMQMNDETELSEKMITLKLQEFLLMNAMRDADIQDIKAWMKKKLDIVSQGIKKEGDLTKLQTKAKSVALAYMAKIEGNYVGKKLSMEKAVAVAMIDQTAETAAEQLKIHAAKWAIEAIGATAKGLLTGDPSAFAAAAKYAAAATAAGVASAVILEGARSTTARIRGDDRDDRTNYERLDAEWQERLDWENRQGRDTTQLEMEYEAWREKWKMDNTPGYEQGDSGFGAVEQSGYATRGIENIYISPSVTFHSEGTQIIGSVGSEEVAETIKDIAVQGILEAVETGEIKLENAAK